MDRARPCDRYNRQGSAKYRRILLCRSADLRCAATTGEGRVLNLPRGRREANTLFVRLAVRSLQAENHEQSSIESCPDVACPRMELAGRDAFRELLPPGSRATLVCGGRSAIDADLPAASRVHVAPMGRALRRSLPALYEPAHRWRPRGATPLATFWINSLGSLGRRSGRPGAGGIYPPVIGSGCGLHVGGERRGACHNVSRVARLQPRVCGRRLSCSYRWAGPA